MSVINKIAIIITIGNIFSKVESANSENQMLDNQTAMAIANLRTMLATSPDINRLIAAGDIVADNLEGSSVAHLVANDRIRGLSLEIGGISLFEVRNALARLLDRHDNNHVANVQ